jgi:Replication-relaxation
MTTTSSNAGALFSPTQRDSHVLKAIAAHGGLTALQASTLFFPRALVHGEPAPHSNCQYRLKCLRAHGYIKRVERYQLLTEGKKPYLYTITRKGAQLLASFLGCELQDLDWRQTDIRLTAPYVEHLILTNDVRIAITKAIQDTPPLQLVTWQDELTLKSTHHADMLTITTPTGKPLKGKLIPDAYMLLSTGDGQEDRHFFLEIDRATETGASSDESQRTWTRKILMYLEYFKRDGLYAQRYGTVKGRVLTVTTSTTRLAHLKCLTEDAGGKQRFWFTTFDRITPQTVLTKPIWQLAQADVTWPLLSKSE